MAIPLLLIEIVIMLIGFPIMATVYYYHFREHLKPNYTTQKLFKHILSFLGVLILCLLVSNVIRFSMGMLFSNLISPPINRLGSLLWATPYQDATYLIIIATLINVFITMSCIYKGIRYLSKKISFSNEVIRYSFITTFFFSLPTLLWELRQVLLTLYFDFS